MTHMKPMSETDGEFTKREGSKMACPKCQQTNVTVQTWESSDGAYEDYKYTCPDCKHVWWIDGIDS